MRIVAPELAGLDVDVEASTGFLLSRTRVNGNATSVDPVRGHHVKWRRSGARRWRRFFLDDAGELPSPRDLRRAIEAHEENGST